MPQLEPKVILLVIALPTKKALSLVSFKVRELQYQGNYKLAREYHKLERELRRCI